MTRYTERSSLSTSLNVLFFLLLILPNIHSKSIYEKYLGEDSYSLVVKIRENYSKVNSRSPSNLVKGASAGEEADSSSRSVENHYATTAPDNLSEEVITADSLSQSERSGERQAVSHDYNTALETSSNKPVSASSPEDLMRLKIESIMSKREDVAQLLQNIAANHMNARYGGYVIQNIPS